MCVVRACVCVRERQTDRQTQCIRLPSALFDFCTCTLTNSPASHHILRICALEMIVIITCRVGVLPRKRTAGSTACRRSFMLCLTVYVHACSWECVAVVVRVCQVAEKLPVAAVQGCMHVSMHARACVGVYPYARMPHTHSARACVCVCVCVHACVSECSRACELHMLCCF